MAQTDTNGNATVYDYDPRGLMVSVIDAKENVTTYDYDANGNLISVIDANNKTRTFEYDELNRLISETNAQNQVKTKAYDPVGNLISSTKADGTNTIEYAYDEYNRLITITYPDDSEVSYTYKDSGARASMTDTHGITSYTYDELGRLESVTRNGDTVTYGYDAVGNITGITYPDGFQVDYTYNDLSLMETASAASQVMDIAYDENGRRTSETLPNGVDVEYQYDDAGRLTVLNHILSGSSLAKSAYTMDFNGNRLTNTDEADQVTNYAYDELNQLLSAEYANGRIVAYTYDPVGNRTGVEDSEAVLPDLATQDYDYDFENRLVTFEDGNQTITYTYDGDGNLIEKTVTEGAITDAYEYFYDYSAGLPRLLVEKKNGTEVYNYIYAGRLIARKDVSGTVYYHQDGLGSTLAITDSTGEILNRYEYNAYGTATVIQESVYNSILFTGEMQDQSGLIYLRARYYDPASGRFTVEDTLFGELDNPLTQNLYAYCLNNPVNYVDPSGHDSQICGFGPQIGMMARNYQLDKIQEFFKGFGGYLSAKANEAGEIVLSIGQGIEYLITPEPDNPFDMAMLQLESGPPIPALRLGGMAGIAGRKAGAKIGEEVGEQVAKHSDDIINGLSEFKLNLQLFGKKRDIKQIESVAKDFKMTDQQRRDFGDYVESLKDLVPNNKNFSYRELKEIAKEFLGVK